LPDICCILPFLKMTRFMTQDTNNTRTIHEGRNVKRFREMFGMKQDALAIELGGDWNQQKISLLEQKETIDAALLAQISAALKIPVEAIQNFDEEQAVNIIANTYSFQDFKDNAVASGFSYQPSFNPIDKVVELYERMLQQQKEMIEKLEKLIERNA
jgi:transcriptional regulator with XRE-family HTH domain